MVWLVWQIGFGFIMPENTWKYDFSNFSLKKRSLTTLECRFLRNFRLSLLRFKKNCDVMEQFWRQIQIQRAKIHKTSLVRSPAQGTFFCGPVFLSTKIRILLPWRCKPRAGFPFRQRSPVHPRKRRDNPCKRPRCVPEEPAVSHPLDAVPPTCSPLKEKRVSHFRVRHFRVTNGRECKRASFFSTALSLHFNSRLLSQRRITRVPVFDCTGCENAFQPSKSRDTRYRACNSRTLWSDKFARYISLLWSW